MRFKRKYREETLQEYKTYKTFIEKEFYRKSQDKEFHQNGNLKRTFHYSPLLRYNDLIYHRKMSCSAQGLIDHTTTKIIYLLIKINVIIAIHISGA